jgi:hypothetical protein
MQYGSDMSSNSFHPSDLIEVRRVTNRGKGGRAVFARQEIRPNQTIERVPVLLIPRAQVFSPPDESQPHGSKISWYVFNWLPTKRDYVALALGYGSIYNHSDDPNARYEMEMPDILRFIAIKPIRVGDEITIDYRGDEGDRKDLGFDAATDSPRPAE